MPSTQILHTPHWRLTSDSHCHTLCRRGWSESCVCNHSCVRSDCTVRVAFIQSCSFPYGNLGDAFQPVFKHFSSELHHLKLCLGVSFHHWDRPAQLVIHPCLLYGQFSVYWNSALACPTCENPLELGGQQGVASPCLGPLAPLPSISAAAPPSMAVLRLGQGKRGLLGAETGRNNALEWDLCFVSDKQTWKS